MVTCKNDQVLVLPAANASCTVAVDVQLNWTGLRHVNMAVANSRRSNADLGRSLRLGFVNSSERPKAGAVTSAVRQLRKQKTEEHVT